ncbi:hypothetical protein MAE30S32_10500 [Microcystis aeruginosa 11-30S32]|uniref:Uncharacterized protein n=1 Tax=Microcystis aeruginosa 11-30S32 TaxID=2358142 RepID=A0A510PF12_MICAE|nr:hypothetical protein MAE30S32_10500 [Microcystis aeruginosa 11-30S32]
MSILPIAPRTPEKRTTSPLSWEIALNPESSNQ